MLFVLGYVGFIWGRLPGHYDPKILDGKGYATGQEFACGWNFRHFMVYQCDGLQFFHDSIKVYLVTFVYIPLVILFGVFLSPFWFLYERSFWPIAIFMLGVYVFIAYLFYRRYKRKYSVPIIKS